MKSTENLQGLKFISIILVLLLALSVLSACHQSIADMDYPDEKLLARILDDYRDSLIEDGLIDKDSDAKCEIVRCYGIYNESVAVIMWSDILWYTDGLSGEVAGVTIFYGSEVVEIWHNGKFYSLYEAYSNELISKDDIIEIARQHNCIGNEWLADEYTQYMSSKNSTATSKEYILEHYYGSYVIDYYEEGTGEYVIHGTWAAMFNDEVSDEPHTETVAGIEFRYKDGNSIKILSREDGAEVMSLQEAYDRKYINEWSLKEIARIHHNESNYPQS